MMLLTGALRIAGVLAMATVAVGFGRAQSPMTQPPMAEPPMIAHQEPPSAEPRAIAAQIADQLETNYLYPDIGRAYASRMRERAASGAYDGLAGTALANALTSDLLAVRDDRHLRVRVGAAQLGLMIRPGGAGPAGGPGSAPPQAADGQPRPSAGARSVPAVEQAGWIAPGIGYIRFNEFPPDPAVTEAVRIFLREHSRASTLIFDLRTTRGGTPAQMDVIFPALFDRPTPLVRMATRPGAAALGPRGPNLRPVDGSAGAVTEYWVTPGEDTPLRHARIFVLTSPGTGSAAEMFAAALKWSRRATLIGSTTAGANHFGMMRPVGGDLSLFVPMGRTYNPADGADWEGTGVAPDVDVPPERALLAALVRAGVSEAEAGALSEQYRPTQPMARPPAITPG
jgi:Peptidase family S41